MDSEFLDWRQKYINIDKDISHLLLIIQQYNRKSDTTSEKDLWTSNGKNNVGEDSWRHGVITLTP